MCGPCLSSLVTSGVLGKVSGDTSLPCMGCRLGKQIQLSYLASQIASTRPFELVHFDVWAPSPFISKGLIAHQAFAVMVHTQLDSFIRVFRVDYVNEFLSCSLLVSFRAGYSSSIFVHMSSRYVGFCDDEFSTKQNP
jgi:hypothetical protein